MELELEISESEDNSEFPAEETVEQRPLCYNCKRKATTVGLCVKKKEEAPQTVSRKVWRKRKRKLRFTTNQSLENPSRCLPNHLRCLRIQPRNNWMTIARP